MAQATRRLLVFAPIAQREVSFYIDVARQIRDLQPDSTIKFLSFYQPGNEQIRAAGYECLDLYDYVKNDWDSRSVTELEQEFGVENLRRYVLHEKVTFNTCENEKLVSKFKSYLFACDTILAKLQKEHAGEEISVFQELGGFIAPLSLFFAARKRQIPHVFFEPAFFKGRILFVLNSLNVMKAPYDLPTSTQIVPEAVSYLRKTLETKSAVIPIKDRHHYMDMGLKKLVNKSNIQKLTAKLKHKYVHGYKQEYEHIFNHTARAAGMFVNRKLVAPLYTEFTEDVQREKFVYFPFHVRLDYVLTTRSPEYFNQIALVEHICRILPAGVKLYAKEHPISIGGFSRSELGRLVHNYDNFKLIHPSTSTYDILDRAHGVITINSKVGAEALALRKPVLVLGESFYSGSRLVRYVPGMRELEKALLELLSGQVKGPSETERDLFFSHLWESSVPGDLYYSENQNLLNFANGIISFLDTLDC